MKTEKPTIETATKHYLEHKDIFDLWIERQERLQISQDLLQPLIEPFKQAHPTVNLMACQDCIIDMLIWVRAEAKKTNPKDKK